MPIPEEATALLVKERLDVDPTGLVGGYSEVFDLISAEYGWSDATIMELTVARARQIVATIQTREIQRNRHEYRLTSWMTRTISQHIAAGYMLGEDVENTTLKNAAYISYDPVERLVLKNAPEAPKENTEGSFERLMGAFSNGGLQGRG